MLSRDEIAALEAILDRARADLRPEPGAEVSPGDVVQLRPGADRTWECSLLLVTQVVNGEIRGQILRPHRGGCREAWARYSPAEVVRVGRTHYPEPPPDIRSWSYDPSCNMCLRKPPAAEGRKPARPRDATALYRNHRRVLSETLQREMIELALEEAIPTKGKPAAGTAKNLNKRSNKSA